MGYTRINKQTLPVAGAALTLTDYDSVTSPAVDGMKFANDGHTYLYAINNNGGSDEAVVTVVSSGTVNGLALADVSVPLSAGEDVFFGPLPVDAFNVQSGTNSNDVLITVTGDAQADVDFGVFS